MALLGTTPWGPFVPEYSTLFTMSRSYVASVLNSSTSIGDIFSELMTMVQAWSLP
jgi:hypothetical protein